MGLSAGGNYSKNLNPPDRGGPLSASWAWKGSLPVPHKLQKRCPHCGCASGAEEPGVAIQNHVDRNVSKDCSNRPLCMNPSINPPS
jgi:hypothetical protein